MDQDGTLIIDSKDELAMLCGKRLHSQMLRGKKKVLQDVAVLIFT